MTTEQTNPQAHEDRIAFLERLKQNLEEIKGRLFLAAPNLPGEANSLSKCADDLRDLSADLSQRVIRLTELDSPSQANDCLYRASEQLHSVYNILEDSPQVIDGELSRDLAAKWLLDLNQVIIHLVTAAGETEDAELTVERETLAVMQAQINDIVDP